MSAKQSRFEVRENVEDECWIMKFPVDHAFSIEPTYSTAREALPTFVDLWDGANSTLLSCTHRDLDSRTPDPAIRVTPDG